MTAFDRPRCVATPDALSVVRAVEQNHSNVVASTQVLVGALVPQTLILESDRIEYGGCTICTWCSSAKCENLNISPISL